MAAVKRAPPGHRPKSLHSLKRGERARRLAQALGESVARALYPRMTRLQRGERVDFSRAGRKVEAKAGGIGSSVVFTRAQLEVLGDSDRVVIVAYQRAVMRMAALARDPDKVRALAAGSARWAVDASAVDVRAALRWKLETTDNVYWPLTAVMKFASSSSMSARAISRVFCRFPGVSKTGQIVDLHVWRAGDKAAPATSELDDSGNTEFDIGAFDTEESE